MRGSAGFLFASVAAAALSLTPAVSAQSAPCDPAAPAAIEFVDLPSKVITGKEARFGFEPTYTADVEPAGPYEVRMLDPRRRPFFEGTLRRLRQRLFIAFDLNDRGPHRVELTYTEIDNLSGAECERTISRRVWPKRLILFPSRCYSGLQRRPRSVIVACGDGNFQLKRMHWRGWNRAVVRGRGLAWANDCIPYCAEGTFHYYPVRAWLSKPRYCRAVQRYAYTRLRYRYLHGSASVPFPCALYASVEG